MRRFGFALAFAFAGCRDGTGPARALDAQAPFDARAFYERSCAGCHGSDGRGNTPQGRETGARDLTRDEVRHRSDAELGHQIVVGGGKMPAFRVLLSDAEVRALVLHLRGLGAR